MTKTSFQLGRLVATPGAMEALQESGETADNFIQRHVSGDCGELCNEDQQANEQALLDGSRILSAYRTRLNVKLWVITEAENDNGRREVTTVLLVSEY